MAYIKPLPQRYLELLKKLADQNRETRTQRLKREFLEKQKKKHENYYKIFRKNVKFRMIF